MATWKAVKQYLTANYDCEVLAGDVIKLVFDVADDRSQLIFVQWAGRDADSATWLDFHTPIGRLGAMDLHAALRRTSSFVVGGLSTMGEIVTLRASLPLENLDRNEIEDPLHLLLNIGDTLERELTGGDDF